METIKCGQRDETLAPKGPVSLRGVLKGVTCYVERRLLRQGGDIGGREAACDARSGNSGGGADRVAGGPKANLQTQSGAGACAINDSDALPPKLHSSSVSITSLVLSYSRLSTTPVPLHLLLLLPPSPLESGSSGPFSSSLSLSLSLPSHRSNSVSRLPRWDGEGRKRQKQEEEDGSISRGGVGGCCTDGGEDNLSWNPRRGLSTASRSLLPPPVCTCAPSHTLSPLLLRCSASNPS